VGALTSKPAKFAGRSWSYKSHFGIAPFDGMGAHLAYHTMYKGYQGIHQLKRVVPESCSHLNHIWLSDRDRFGYEAIEHNRVLTPLLRVGNKLEPISYEQAFKVLSDHFSRLSDQQKERSAVIVSPQTASEVGVKIATLFRKMDMHHIDIGTHQSLYSPDVALVPASAEPEEIEQAQTILLIGTALRWEQPYLSLRVQKAQENGAKVLSLGSIKHHYNFPVEHKMASAQHLIHDAMVLLNEWGVCQHHQDWSKDLTQSRVVVLVGDEALSHPQAIHLNHAIQYYAQKYVFKYVLLSQGANSLGLYESGCMPYQAGQIYGKRWYEVTDYLDFVWLHQLDPVYDLALDAEKLQASFVVSCSSHLTDSLSLCADLIFPNALPPEQAGTYTNYFGHQQQFESAIVPAFQTPIELFENIANDMQISLNAIDASIKPIAIEKPDIVKPLVDKHYVVKIRHWVDMDIWLREAPALKNAYPIIQGMLVHPSYQPKDQQWQQFLLPSEDVARGTSVVYRNSKADVMLHQIAKIRSSSC
jgi:NADH-quinone oxidoreductase subunit G